MSYLPLDPKTLDEAHYQMHAAVRNFFRFDRRHPDDAMPDVFDDAYYQKVANNIKALTDHEMKYLHSPHLE